MSDCDKDNVFIYSAIFSHNAQRNHVYFEFQSALINEVKRRNPEAFECFETLFKAEMEGKLIHLAVY